MQKGLKDLQMLKVSYVLQLLLVRRVCGDLDGTIREAMQDWLLGL